jgi:arabinogalactan endo-1,4-beta-galactosidase
MRTFTFTVLLSGFALTLLQGTVALTYRGADITSVPQVESSGKSYVDGGQRKNFENIIASKGANTARIRIWTAGANDLNYGLNYAKRVKQAGLTLIVDLHYSDTCECP